MKKFTMSKRPYTDEELLAYAAGEIDGEHAARIAAHLETDPDAAQRVALYRLSRCRLSTDDSVEPPSETVARAKAIFQPQVRGGLPTWPERLIATIAKIVYDSRIQPATVRYGDNGTSFQMSFETGALDVDLQAERKEDEQQRHARWRLIGQVSAPDGPGSVEISLVPAGTEKATQTTQSDDRSLFTLEADPGVYDIRIKLAHEIIILPGVDVR